MFMHHRLQGLEQLLQSANIALRAHTDRDPGLGAVVVAYLNDAITAYHGFGIPDAENEMVVLKAQVAEARDGVNPLTLERVTTRRREMQRTVALHVLQASGERLRADYADVRRSLTELRDRLSPLALYALQKGLVPSASSRDLTQSELEQLWQALMVDPESQPAARRVALGATTIDALLVLGDLLESVRSLPA
jgi:hypothetical protein